MVGSYFKKLMSYGRLLLLTSISRNRYSVYSYICFTEHLAYFIKLYFVFVGKIHHNLFHMFFLNIKGITFGILRVARLRRKYFGKLEYVMNLKLFVTLQNVVNLNTSACCWTKRTFRWIRYIPVKKELCLFCTNCVRPFKEGLKDGSKVV